MSWVQVKSPNLNANAQVGMCLEYVQNAFASGWAGPDAWTAWTQHVKHRHGNRNWPSGATYIPIWFSGTWNGNYYGHVAILNTRTGQVYTSPYYKSTGHEVYSSIEAMMNTFSGVMSDITYRGWSEDIGGTTVIKKGDDMVEDTQRHYDLYAQTWVNATGRKLTRNEFRISFVGRDKAEVQTLIHTSAETAAYARLAANGKKLPSVQAELTKSKAETAQVKAQLADKDKQIAAQSKEIARLLAQVALQSDDTKNLNAFGQALQWFVSRVGLK